MGDKCPSIRRGLGLLVRLEPIFLSLRRQNGIQIRKWVKIDEKFALQSTRLEKT